MNNPQNPPISQSNFDARLEYYQSIGELWRASNMFVSMGNYDSWHRSLLMLVNNHPFMSVEKQSECDALLGKAKQHLESSKVRANSNAVSMQRQYFLSLAINELSAVHRAIIRSYQEHHMLLPEKANSDDDSDNDIAHKMGL